MLIIGAGVMGSAAARELARYRLKIGVLDKTPDVCTAVSASAAAPAVLSPIPKMKKHATPLTLVKGRYTMVSTDGQMHTVSPRYEQRMFSLPQKRVPKYGI